MRRIICATMSGADEIEPPILYSCGILSSGDDISRMYRYLCITFNWFLYRATHFRKKGTKISWYMPGNLAMVPWRSPVELKCGVIFWSGRRCGVTLRRSSPKLPYANPQCGKGHGRQLVRSLVMEGFSPLDGFPPSSQNLSVLHASARPICFTGLSHVIEAAQGITKWRSMAQ